MYIVVDQFGFVVDTATTSEEAAEKQAALTAEA